MAVNMFDLDAAVIQKLLADPQLTAVCPDGVYYGPARTGAQRFVTVTRIDDDPERGFSTGVGGGVAWDVVLYQVTAVLLDTGTANIKNAAGRIHALLQEASFTATGWRVMLCESLKGIRYVEVDGVNADLRWQHGGGQYQIHAIPTA